MAMYFIFLYIWRKKCPDITFWYLFWYLNFHWHVWNCIACIKLGVYGLVVGVDCAFFNRMGGGLSRRGETWKFNSVFNINNTGRVCGIRMLRVVIYEAMVCGRRNQGSERKQLNFWPYLILFRCVAGFCRNPQSGITLNSRQRSAFLDWKQRKRETRRREKSLGRSDAPARHCKMAATERRDRECKWTWQKTDRLRV